MTYPEEARQLAGSLRSHGYRSSVAAPVSLAGGLWGALVASSLDETPAPRRLRAAPQRLRRPRRAGARERRRPRQAGRLACTHRGRRRRRAPPPRAQPARRRAAAPRLARAPAAADPERARAASRRRARTARRGAGRALARARRAARAGARHPPRDPHRPRPRPGARGDHRARARCRSSSPSCPTTRLPEPVEAAVYYVVAETITNMAKHAQAESATRQRAPRRERRPTSSSPTTASAAPTPPAARACAASPTASRRSTAPCASRARPAAARASRPGSPVAERAGASGPGYPWCGSVAQGIEQEPSKLPVAGSNPVGPTCAIAVDADVLEQTPPRAVLVREIARAEEVRLLRAAELDRVRPSPVFAARRFTSSPKRQSPPAGEPCPTRGPPAARISPPWRSTAARLRLAVGHRPVGDDAALHGENRVRRQATRQDRRDSASGSAENDGGQGARPRTGRHGV